MELKNLAVIAAVLLPVCCAAAAVKHYEVASPDGALALRVDVGEKITWSLSHDGDELIVESPMSMTLEDGSSYGIQPGRAACRKVSVDRTIEASFYKKAEIRDCFNEMTLNFKSFSLIFRAYDEGVAYRFVSKSKTPFKVVSEEAEFVFPQDAKAYIPYVLKAGTGDDVFEPQFFNSFENTYEYSELSGWETGRLAFLPLVVEAAGGRKICITEADLQNYPGMYLYNSDGNSTLEGVFAAVPDKIEQGGHNMLQGVVKSRKPYIAECGPGEVFPWRVVVVSEEDKELADNDMVYKLAEPADPDIDFSWVKPGKVAWEWWNDWNLYGEDVDFRTGINNPTYKYYIDFASEHGIEYVILDEGWAVNLQADLMQVAPEIDLQELVDYGKERNVGIILWAGYLAFDRDLEDVCRYFSDMGVKGFKVDFMDRDDQLMVRFHSRAAEVAARYHLMLDYHGTYKPTGLHRTWPNVVNYEGVHGLEQMKWSPVGEDQVTYDVTIPFIRMVAGPMDYTQGAMRNASKANYYPVNNEPMSQGTRCRQLAEYVVFESPVNMLCDSPSNYKAEPECTEFIAGVPEVWDETIALDGKIAEYVVIARRKGDTWYVGGMTDWNARTLTIDLSFLGEGQYSMELYRDGANADRAARDYRKETIPVPSDLKLTVSMAPGGGFSAKITADKTI